MASDDKSRFEFGTNWANFVDKHFSQERVDISSHHLLDFIGRESLEGLSVLDIGCGSGLHSLAAWQAKARSIHSFDYDPKSVETTRTLHKLAKSPVAWKITQGSVLDETFMNSLDQADLVYSWGVLHHTGDVWNGLRQACGRVASGGLLYIAIYSADMQVDPPPEYWLDIKKRYVAASLWRRRWMELAYLWHFRLNRKPWRLLPLLLQAWRYKKSRGMNYMTDVRDWLGGWPMEFCRDADVVSFVTGEFSLKLEKMKTGEANTEFLFSKAPST
jgi:2-polyprenyl-6-hydroxyphenyl methylase/3-demethylubiquinone-9 3-methyltransferase